MRRQSSTHKRRKSTPEIDVSGHAGEWVAIHPKTYRVMGHGASPDQAMRGAASSKGVEPVLYYVPKSDAFFVGVSA